MSDWEPQADWSTVKVGDQVRVTCDEGILAGKVRYVVSGVLGDFHSIGVDVPSLPDSVVIHRSEWSLFVPAKPAVELPTEPGVYYGSQFGADVPFFLGADGGWRTSAKQVHVPERHMPLVKLEPVAVTAKKVCAFIGFAPWPIGMTLQEVLDVALEEFGVTDE